jgi:hypothetical protein
LLPVFDFATVESAPIGDLPFKRRAAGKSALDILNKKKYLTAADFILGGFLDPENDSDDSDDSIFDVDSDDEMEEDDLEDEEEPEILDLMGLFYLFSTSRGSVFLFDFGVTRPFFIMFSC